MSNGHWTGNSFENFAYQVASDFVSQIENTLESRSIDRKEYAEKLTLTPGRVSQLLNNPGNLTLKNMVRCARALGLKVAVVAYDDGDSTNEKGPVVPQVFSTLWQQAGRPHDLFDMEAPPRTVACSYKHRVQRKMKWWDSEVFDHFEQTFEQSYSKGTYPLGGLKNRLGFAQQVSQESPTVVMAGVLHPDAEESSNIYGY